MEENNRRTILEWKRRVDRAIFMHYESAKYVRHLHLWLGVPVLIITSFVGASIFTKSSFDTQDSMTVILGILSFIGAILSGLQTFLNYQEISQKHENSANDYGCLRREIEHLLISKFKNEEELGQRVIILKERIDSIAKQSIVIPSKVWKKHYKKYEDLKEESFKRSD